MAPSVEPSASPEAIVKEFVGEGTQTTKPFNLLDGNYLVTWKVTDGPCTVDFTLLQPAQSDRYPLGHVATNDKAEGHFALDLLGDAYRLEVKDPGCLWTVTIEQQ